MPALSCSQSTLQLGRAQHNWQPLADELSGLEYLLFKARSNALAELSGGSLLACIMPGFR